MNITIKIELEMPFVMESVNKQVEISDNEYKLKINADDSVHNFKMGRDFELISL